MRYPIFALVALVSLCFVAAEKKQKITVRFHTEGVASDGESFTFPARLAFAQKDVTLGKLAILSENDIKQATVFQAGDGTYGAYFILSSHGKFTLEATSEQLKNSFIVAFVNGRQVVDMQIDKKITDGIISIPFGLSEQEAALIIKELGKLKKE